MAEPSTIRVTDARALLRLFGEVAELPNDAGLRSQHLVSRLCDILGGQCGMIAVLQCNHNGPKMVFGVEGGHLDDAGRRIYADYARGMHVIDPLLDALEPGAISPRTVVRRECIPDAQWYRSEFVNEVKFKVGVDDATYAFHPLDNGRHIGLGINRARGRRFAAREKVMLDLVNQEMGWFFRKLPTSSGAGLPPRLRTVLNYLVKGESEKRIARVMNLSPHTIHDYVKELHRRFDVSSRGELLAKVYQVGSGREPGETKQC